MTNRTRALGYRLLGSLKNERIIVSLFTTSLYTNVSLINGKTGKPFAAVRENEWGQYWVATASGEQGWHESFVDAIRAIKAEPTYPKPRERRSFVRPVARAPRALGVKIS